MWYKKSQHASLINLQLLGYLSSDSLSDGKNSNFTLFCMDRKQSRFIESSEVDIKKLFQKAIKSRQNVPSTSLRVLKVANGTDLQA